MIATALSRDGAAPLQNDRPEDRARWALFGIIAGMLALPMVPGWQGLIRLLAIYLLFHALLPRLDRGGRRALIGAISLGLLGFAVAWVDSAVTAPGRHIIGTLTDVYGLALPLYGGVAVTLLDLVLIGGLAALVVGRSRLAQAGLALGAGFWALSFGGPVVRGLSGTADPAQVAQMLAGSAEWAVWVLLLGLCLALIRKAGDAFDLLRAVAIGGVMMAAVIALQIAFSDFAYVLDAAHLEDYFYRARGTAYYHAPAVYTVAISLLILIGFFHAARGAAARRGLLAALSVALAIVISLNDTRGLNLALVGGTGLFAALMLMHRDWKAMALSLVIMGIIASNMIYMKPAIGGVVPDPDVSQSLLEILSDKFEAAFEKPEPVMLSDKAPVIDGSLRLVLMKSGLHAMLDHMLWGTGIGALELVISQGEGYVFSSTYSSHTLYIDFALMAGVPALGCFLLLCGLGFLNGLVSSFRDWRQRRNGFAPGVLGACVVIGVGAVFLPQEMNNIVALFFVFAALLLVPATPATADGADDRATSGFLHGTPGKAYTALLGLAVLGWAFLTSPTYTLPILNLVGRHGAEIARTQASVYVSTPLAAPLARVMLRLRGVPDPDVRLLPDDPDALPLDDAFIIWHPATDWRYPVLKAELPYRFIRPKSTAPSVEFPVSWWMLKSVPYAGFLLQAGDRPAIDAFADAPGVEDIPPDLTVLPDVGRFIGIVKLFHPPMPGRPRGSSLVPNAKAPLGPNDLKTVNFGIARTLTDANPSTGLSWRVGRRETIYLDMDPVPHTPLAAYRFIPWAMTSSRRVERMAWRLMGTNDMRDWTVLDQRSVNLGSVPEEAPVFTIANPRFYRYLAFVFEGQPGIRGNNLLGDLELFPSPRTAASPNG